MCGIAGIVSKVPDVDVRAVSVMQDALRHRGPDGAGEFHDDHICVAMRRLSIIDPEGGMQPFYSEDRSIVLIANGEIYNFVELRSDLEARGVRLRTKSDCEVILHLYQKYGTDCIHRLRGMFAFAIWDSREQRLVLARDRMGEKPLYLYENDEKIIFASEMKALLASGHVPFELEPASVNLYFHYQFVPEPRTALKRVKKLPAAHMMIVDVAPWRVREVRYWSMEDAPKLRGDPAELIRARLDEVMRIVIRSDVPVGVALSGGIDSSAVTALAARHYPGSLSAFSVGYPGRPASDERSKAAAFARHLGLPFHDIELSTDDMVAGFAKLVLDRDDPVADISGYGYYAVMRLAREHGVPVMIQGQGGDELFWGYPWLQDAARISRMKYLRMVKRIPGAIAAFGDPAKLITAAPWRVRSWGALRKGIRAAWEEYRAYQSSPGDRLVFYDLTPDFRNAVEDLPALYSPAFLDAVRQSGREADPYHLFTKAQPWPETGPLITRLICETYLLGNGVTQGDRLAMASSVEMRLPLLDYRLVETVIGLRKTHVDHHLPQKFWLKQAVARDLPKEVLNRPKQGFTPPVGDWYLALRDAYGGSVDDGFLVNAGVLTQKAGHSLSKTYYTKGTVAPLSFKTLVLETWCRQMAPIAAAARDTESGLPIRIGGLISQASRSRP